MRILFAADEHPYSLTAMPQVERLGENTWADITILGVEKKSAIDTTLKAYHNSFMDHFDPEALPYSPGRNNKNLQGGIRKQIKTRVRRGDPAKEILEEARQMGSDLIVMGCSEKKCDWQGAGDIPLKVARNADCSVLIIKAEKKIRRVLCCLDHTNITQASLEMINQMVTLFHSGLEIVVLTDGRKMDKKLGAKLSALLKYYVARNIYPSIETVKLSSLERFVSQQARWGLMALWMGKKSIFESVFPSSKVSRLLKVNNSSVLLLR
ncbi:universal stress protein [Desulfospira joergensenii]|uniref:universal stress protein n=1 Tax=Desulfospira joergensenii TaxID=53329 RepID=UPI0003B31B6E|nr:universal stress protein [Desulfospira joergensenii]